jgi:hypothetical protein
VSGESVSVFSCRCRALLQTTVCVKTTTSLLMAVRSKYTSDHMREHAMHVGSQSQWIGNEDSPFR